MPGEVAPVKSSVDDHNSVAAGAPDDRSADVIYWRSQVQALRREVGELQSVNDALCARLIFERSETRRLSSQRLGNVAELLRSRITRTNCGRASQ